MIEARFIHIDDEWTVVQFTKMDESVRGNLETLAQYDNWVMKSVESPSCYPLENKWFIPGDSKVADAKPILCKRGYANILRGLIAEYNKSIGGKACLCDGVEVEVVS